jgi:hypothetical protein
MSGFKVFGIKILNSQTENEMRDFFDRYEKILNIQKTKTLDDITEWEDKLIRDIQKYVSKQRLILEQDYTNQIGYLNKTYKQFIEELQVHEHTKNTGQINQLLERCNALKFQLVSINYHGQNLPFLHLTRAVEPEDVKSDEYDVIEARNERLEKNLPGESNGEAAASRNTYPDSRSNPGVNNAKQIQ